MLLHGSGADENDLLGLGRELDPQANLLSPRALLTQDGLARFFLYDEGFLPVRESVIQAAQEMREFLLAASEKYGFTLGNVVAVGFSNGSHLALALLTIYPELFAGAIAFGTTEVFEESPNQPELEGKFLFVANGAADPYSPRQRTERMLRQFENFGAEVRFWQHPQGHQISQEHVREISDLLSS